MFARDIIEIMNKIAPEFLINKSWDNSGLQVGSLDKKISSMIVSLDITPNLVLEAINNKIDMIITHHPFFFTPINKITPDDIRGKMIYDIIKNDIVVFSAHTNLDTCRNSINEILAQELELSDLEILSKVYSEKLYKVVVFVPQTHKEIIRNSMSENGAGYIGNYSHCTFNVKGIGTFMPREGTNPYIGRVNSIELVEEERIETIVSERNIKEVVSSMLSVHPYEEVAYDIYPLKNVVSEYGYGRTGYLTKELTIEELALFTKKKIKCDNVRVYGNKNKSVKKVAVCSGSGNDFIREAYKKNVDVFITGDVKYHDAQLALELDLPIIDANHFDTEKVILPYLRNYFENILGDEIGIFIYQESGAPFITI